jgi:ATP-dependent helicase/nuclease subunit A
MSRLPLFDPPDIAVDGDNAARAFAVDPRHNVVLEASAGTGKTTVLVQRYVNLLRAGVEPANILAITFTRKAATEMRERIIAELRKAAVLSELDRQRWQTLRDRIGEISISTIDAFCLSLLREFPLEADLDPGFEMADETEVPRFIEEALDRSMRIFTARAVDDPDIALVIAQLGASRTRAGLASLLDRRLVAWDALDRFLARGPRDLHADDVCRRAAAQLLDLLHHVRGGLTQFLADGPSHHPRYQLFIRQVQRLAAYEAASNAQIRTMLDRVSQHFLKQDGTGRSGGAISPYKASDYPGESAARRHRDAVFDLAPQVERVMRQFARELNVVLSRGIRRMFAIALAQYHATLEARAALDFADVLERALSLLRRMDEFSQSRYRLESRYHHVLVDEFQDTSRAQWELVSLLIESWGEGMGLAANPSIFIVGDRKQSIYRFRDAEVAVLQEAGRYIENLRPSSNSRRAISRSFRSVPELLEFVNQVCAEMSSGASRAHEFTYGEMDRFPAVELPPEGGSRRDAPPVLGIAVGDSIDVCAEAVAGEIARILAEEVVRDKRTGVPRAAKPGDIGILFRSRTSHREFERALDRRGIPTYVYKGLGFFDADEIKDACALIRYLAQPASDLRAAALLRSGIARLSDAALERLAPGIAGALLEGCPPTVALDQEDARVLAFVREHIQVWLDLVDRIPPADLFEAILPAVAYAYELRGARQQQAWENLKKMRGLIRRIQNRGYATLARIADHIDALSAGDESNAVLEAIDAVNLMTVHASKGLEFPVVFVVNMARGATGLPRPVRVIVDGHGQEPSVSVSPFVSELDALEREREQHETRRLLYVAMTRARDRLYFSSALKEGVLKPGPGSLAEVLPPSLKPVFSSAASTSEAMATWTSASGRRFKWRICRVERDAEAGGAAATSAPAETADFTNDWLTAESTVHLPVTEWLAQTSGTAQLADARADDQALIGLLVHRLFEAASRWGADFDAGSAVRTLMTPDERAEAADPDRATNAAIELWDRLRSSDYVASLLTAGQILAEVPFSMRLQEPGRNVVLRGTIDAVVLTDDATATVVEFKTGGRRPEHEMQLALYIDAARALFPDRQVNGRLIYA